MTSWEQMEWLIAQAQKGGYYQNPTFKPFKYGDRVGHNSHYRFIWLPSWWEALFDERWQEYQHKALDYANAFGPNKVITFMYEEKRSYDATQKEENQTESQQSHDFS